MPPGLAWLSAFCSSTGAALGQEIVAEAESTVNALTYKVRLSWREPIRTNLHAQVWNLFQKWAAVNGATPSSRLDIAYETNPLVTSTRVEGFTVTVHLRERLGHPKVNRP